MVLCFIWKVFFIIFTEIYIFVKILCTKASGCFSKKCLFYHSFSRISSRCILPFFFGLLFSETFIIWSCLYRLPFFQMVFLSDVFYSWIIFQGHFFGSFSFFSILYFGSNFFEFLTFYVILRDVFFELPF